EQRGVIRREDISLSELNQVYETFIQAFNGGLKRDEKWWKQRVLTDDKAEVILIKDEEENPQAYLIYKLNNKRFEIIEMDYLSQAYKESMYHFMMKDEATIKEVSLHTYKNDYVSYIIKDHNFYKNKI